MTRLRLLPPLFLLLAVTACGAGDPTDQERLEAALLRLSDFPSDQGWTVEPAATDDPAQDDFDAAIDRCEEQHDPTADVSSADGDSDDFTRGDLVLAGSSASVVSEAEARDALFEAMDPLLECFGAAMLDALSREYGETARVSPPFPLEVTTAADRTEGRAIQFSVDPVSVFIDVVAIEQGPTLLYGMFLHQGELTVQDEQDILAPAVERMKEHT
jgi:hypothetical protein